MGNGINVWGERKATMFEGIFRDVERQGSDREDQFSRHEKGNAKNN